MLLATIWIKELADLKFHQDSKVFFQITEYTCTTSNQTYKFAYTIILLGEVESIRIQIVVPLEEHLTSKRYIFSYDKYNINRNTLMILR